MKQGVPITLCAKNFGISVTGDIPEPAKTAPLDRESVLRSLSKLGSTPYELRDFDADIESGLMLPVSKLNALRRTLTDRIADSYITDRAVVKKISDLLYDTPSAERVSAKSAVFYNAAAVTESAKDYFDLIYTPLEAYNGTTNGVMLPAVIYDSEKDMIKRLLRSARELGAEHALVGNLGHLELVKEIGLIPHGDLRLNVSNNETMAVLEGLGFVDVILSPELTLPKIRDIGGRSYLTVYGRIPLMVTEKCVNSALGDCKTCGEKAGRAWLVDRKGVRFPVFKTFGHRSIIFNSAPFYMADKQAELDRARITMQHFVFTVENKTEAESVISSYKKHQRPSDNLKIKRIK
jgi:putative protease